MKQRHHRKRVQRAQHIRTTKGRRPRFIIISPSMMDALKADCLPSDFDVAMAVDNRTAKEVECYRAEAEKRLRNVARYGTSHPEFYQQEWQPRERTKLELAAMEIAQQAELFDRTLPHYVLKRGFEAIPADAGARHLSDRNFRSLISAASERLGVDRSEVVRAERDYSRSNEFAQWLRANPPECRYQ